MKMPENDSEIPSLLKILGSTANSLCPRFVVTFFAAFRPSRDDFQKQQQHLFYNSLHTILFRAEKQQQQQLRNVPIKSGGEEQKTLSQLKAEMYNKETATATSKKLRKGLAI